MNGSLKAPFPWFGGKRRVAAEVWRRFGEVGNYVEPFFGSGAVLLGRPGGAAGIETVNDLDGFVCNAWRAIKISPDETAEHASYPAVECDLHARHVWLLQHRETLRSRLEGDPDWHDPKIAGWWLWGIACWIGGGFCSGNGPWHVQEGKLVRSENSNKQGVSRCIIQLRNAGEGINGRSLEIRSWFQALADRLARVRVCSGDWSRVLTPAPTTAQGLTAILLDPPYADTANRDANIYRVDSLSVAHDVRDWAVSHGDDPLLRIALCGFEGEHQMPDTWTVHAWRGSGYDTLGKDSPGRPERIWFSPHCLIDAMYQGVLWSE